MLKAQSNNQRGFSAVEVLLAAAVFGVIVTAIAGALVYGRASTAQAGERNRANLLAEEGLEAIRNIRDAGYTNLVDGTYGLVQSGGTWTLSGSSDVTNNFTRQVTVAANGTNRKLITSNVSWAQGAGTTQTNTSTLLTNWTAAIAVAKSWANAIQQGTADISGTVVGYRIATQGDYAYLIRNASTANFYVINIANPAAPTVVGTLNVAANPTNIAVNGNYVYLSTSSDTAELQIINVTNPAAPAISGSYNASGTANGQGVDVIGTTAYLARAANSSTDEFIIINAANPAAPARVGGFGNNNSMNEVYVNGTVAYLATSSDTQEVMVMNIATPSAPSLSTSINLSGTNNATTIDGFGTTLAIGQTTILYTYSISSPLAPTAADTLTMGGTMQDISADATHSYIHVGTNGAGTEFQVVNAVAANNTSILRSVDIAGTSIVNGVAYNTTKDVTPAAASINVQELIVFGPN
jgi:prepilin-type N-terminal cleavage/methylation domain-containing protein